MEFMIIITSFVGLVVVRNNKLQNLAGKNIEKRNGGEKDPVMCVTQCGLLNTSFHMQNSKIWR